MKSRFLAVPLLLVSLALVASAQTQSTDPLSALKNLSQDTQDSLLQGLSGKSGAANTKTDPKLSTPETIEQKPVDLPDELGRYRRERTLDGHTLRQLDENPEIRADDTVLIDLTPVDLGRPNYNQNSANGQNPGGLNVNGNLGNVNDINGALAAGIANGANGNSIGANTNGTNTNSQNSFNRNNNSNYDYGRLREKDENKDKRVLDEEKEKIDRKRQLILRGNPYHLNRFGVLELPGLPAMPLAGLTADEATNRLSADPDLRDFNVKVTLLRLQNFDEAALKPFGYDLFEGVPSTFAPVSDIQVPMDYLVGPGDTLTVQLYGNEPAQYSLTVQRDGRLNFPKLGPIMVSGLTFNQARATIEDRVQQQLIGSRVSVTMGDLRSIRVFVLGEAQKPGSYTVSGLSTMTNALFVSGGVKKIGSLRKIELKRNGKLVSVLDLYDLLLHGDTSGDQQLMPGDVIFIPPIGETASVYGAVRRPAIYELKNEKTVEQLVDVAGGLQPDADGKTAQVERIKPSRLAPNGECRSNGGLGSAGRDSKWRQAARASHSPNA